jgi:RNA polymerase sigma factor (sigma-70 family)
MTKLRALVLDVSPDLLQFYLKTRSAAVRNKLVMDNRGFVFKFVRALAPGSDEDDLVQAATIGLIEAVERYNPAKGSFLEFARWRMLHEVQKAIRNKRGINASKSGEESNPREQAAILGWQFPGGRLVRRRVEGDGKDQPDSSGRHHPRTNGGMAAVEARVDLQKVVDNATTSEMRAMMAQMDGAGGGELAEAFNLTGSKHDRDLACQRTRRAFAKARRRLEDD